VGLSSAGIGSNLPVDSIISQLMAVEQQPLTALDNKVASYQSKLSAIGTVKSALSAFQTAVHGLSSITKFQSVKATVGDTTVASAIVGASATPGNYSLEVSKLAQAQKLASAGQASASAAIGAGTITFDMGTITGGTFDAATGKYSGASFASNGAGAKTVTIDPAASSLTDIRDAINKAGIGVSAAIVNDGSASPYRLVLTETSSGKSSSMNISVSGDAGLQALLNHDPAGTQALTETVTAQDAQFTLDGIAISSASNTATNVIDGVTLNLSKTNVGAPTTIAIASDSAGITASINQFVSAYNQVNKTLTDLSAYNPTTKTAAVLNGDSTVRRIQTQLRSLLSSPVGNGGTTFSVLSDIGVSVKAGVMAVDDAKLQKAFTDHPSAIASLFAAVGTPSDSMVTFKGATANTVSGSYAVDVTQAALRGSVAGGATAAGTAITASNNTINVTLDGQSAVVTLDIGNYTADALALQVQSKINGASAFSSVGASVSVSQSSGVLTITSNRYGPASGVSIAGDAGGTNLLGAAPTTTAGADVAGSIGGVAATGSGRTLTGAVGSPVEGMSLLVDGGSGNRGSVNYSQGYAYQFDQLLTSILADDGPLTSHTDGINASIKDLGSSREQLTARLALTEQRYRTQFTALDTMMSSMSTTSAYLTQQLAQLSRM
jgi:flagellar hook-associated protein 2